MICKECFSTCTAKVLTVKYSKFGGIIYTMKATCPKCAHSFNYTRYRLMLNPR